MKKLEIEEKKRLKKVLKKAIILLTVAVLYAIFVRNVGWGIPCVYKLLTKKLCPGCGISRMFLSLFRFDFVSAAKYNLLVLISLPFALFLVPYKSYQYIKAGKTKTGKFETVFYLVFFVLCIAFYFIRNSNIIPFFTIS